MKHPPWITLVLLGLFLVSQLVGLLIVSYYYHSPLPYGFERPVIHQEQPFATTAYVIIMILIATGLILLLARFKLGMLWKLWYGLAIFISLLIALGTVLPSLLVIITAVVLTLLKIFWRHPLLHNATELLMYGGIGAIFAPILTPLIGILILIVIAIYDFIAVRKTEHMVTLAEFQTQQKLFGGFVIPYKNSQAILGGGDVAFPLMFTGIFLPTYGYYSLIITACATLSLGLLFILAQKKKYYPAMPFISAGCLIGYGILLLI